jgi:uncharacterized integral membrane protein
MNWAGFLFWDFRGPLVLTSHAHATVVSTPGFVFTPSLIQNAVSIEQATSHRRFHRPTSISNTTYTASFQDWSPSDTMTILRLSWIWWQDVLLPLYMLQSTAAYRQCHQQHLLALLSILHLIHNLSNTTQLSSSFLSWYQAMPLQVDTLFTVHTTDTDHWWVI